jgi:hypothetical protein
MPQDLLIGARPCTTHAMSALPYATLPPAPEMLTGPGVLARLVDGMGFRYRWATEGLVGVDLSFRANPEALTLGELLVHMHGLLGWVASSVRGPSVPEPDRLTPRPEAWPELRADTLVRLVDLRQLLLETPAEQLAAVTLTGDPEKGPEPFWNAINGPLADFLTHVGQVASWRRMAGNPAPRADVFRGRPPGT